MQSKEIEVGAKTGAMAVLPADSTLVISQACHFIFPNITIQNFRHFFIAEKEVQTPELQSLSAASMDRAGL